MVAASSLSLPMRGKVNSRSAYDFASPASRGMEGSPPPTSASGSSRWATRCRAEISASRLRWSRNWISSSKKTTPESASVATCPSATSKSLRSSSRSPESAVPVSASTSIESSKPPGTLTEKALSTPSARRARSLTRSARLIASSTRRDIRAISWRSSVSWRISLKAGNQPRLRAMSSNVVSSTVLPTPRRPVISMLRSGLPRSSRPSNSSKCRSCSSRPVSAGGLVPAPGVYGLFSASI